MIPNGWEKDFEMARNRSDSLGLNSNWKLSPGKKIELFFYQFFDSTWSAAPKEQSSLAIVIDRTKFMHLRLNNP